MIRDITLGQYYPGESVIHRLDPRTKLIGTLIFMISVFLFHTFFGYIAAGIFLGAVILLSGVPVRLILKSLKPIFILLVITVVTFIVVMRRNKRIRLEAEAKASAS